jgi:hypothetical protein
VGGGGEFELLTPSGKSCGKVALPVATGMAQVDFGRDGTAFVFTVDSSDTVGHQRCTYRWWPGLIR